MKPGTKVQLYWKDGWRADGVAVAPKCEEYPDPILVPESPPDRIELNREHPDFVSSEANYFETHGSRFGNLSSHEGMEVGAGDGRGYRRIWKFTCPDCGSEIEQVDTMDACTNCGETDVDKRFEITASGLPEWLDCVIGPFRTQKRCNEIFRVVDRALLEERFDDVNEMFELLKTDFLERSVDRIELTVGFLTASNKADLPARTEFFDELYPRLDRADSLIGRLR